MPRKIYLRPDGPIAHTCVDQPILPCAVPECSGIFETPRVKKSVQSVRPSRYTENAAGFWLGRQTEKSAHA